MIVKVSVATFCLACVVVGGGEGGGVMAVLLLSLVSSWEEVQWVGWRPEKVLVVLCFVTMILLLRSAARARNKAPRYTIALYRMRDGCCVVFFFFLFFFVINLLLLVCRCADGAR